MLNIVGNGGNKMTQQDWPLVSVVSANYNGRDLLPDLLQSLIGLDYPKEKLETILVDNGSQDDSLAYVQANFPQTKIISSQDNNYCLANNLGIANAKGKYVAFLNNDAKVAKNWLNELIKVIDKDDQVAAVGSKILLPDGRIQSVGHIQFPNLNWADKGFLEEDKQQYNQITEVESISNCAALYRKKVLEGVGFFDEDFNMYMEDVDMAFRVRKKGWRILYVPGSVVQHRLHGSKQKEELRQFFIIKNRLLFIAKHFPDKLPESICNFGDIIRLPQADFQKILILLSAKLVKHYKNNKAKEIISEVRKNVETIGEYQKHSFRVELDFKTKEIQQQAVTLQAELEKRSLQISELGRSIQEKDQLNQSQLNEIRLRDKELEKRNLQISELGRSIQEKDQLNQSQLNEIRLRDKELEKRNLQISELNGLAQEKERSIQEKERSIQERLEEIKLLNGELLSQREELLSQAQAIKIKDKEIGTKERIIIEKTEELSKFYNSETYRLLVKPFIWPVLSFLKKIKRLFCKLPNTFFWSKKKEKEADICVAQFFAKTYSAKSLQINEYIIKIANKGFKEEKVRLMIDIYPYQNRSHPHRHFAYSAVEVTIKPRDHCLLEMSYDWERSMIFTEEISKEKKELVDFWRGTFSEPGLYLLAAVILNKQGSFQNRIQILQRLEC
ncbi:MAG: glycosyltransferase [Candidatus Omnitrophica bacterium]|nr:glycosyltransferase [Candidatus Omnitrophota bacterium]